MSWGEQSLSLGHRIRSSFPTYLQPGAEYDVTVSSFTAVGMSGTVNIEFELAYKILIISVCMSSLQLQ